MLDLSRQGNASRLRKSNGRQVRPESESAFMNPIRKQAGRGRLRRGRPRIRRLAIAGMSLAFLANLASLNELDVMPALAQSGRKVPPRPSSETIVRLETTEVLLPLTAFDAEGRYVTDLTPRDLIVVEEGHAREITSLRREPASIVLLLDVANGLVGFKDGSLSAYKLRDESRETIQDRRNRPLWEPLKRYDYLRIPAAREFAEHFVSGLAEGDQITILQYSDRVELLQDWTQDREAAIASLRWKFRVGSNSSYYDALARAALQLEKRPGRRVIVLLSDGLDDASRGNRRAAVEAVSRTGAAVFVVEWRSVLRGAVYDDAMRITEEEREALNNPSFFLQLLKIFFLKPLEHYSGLEDYLKCLDRIFDSGSLELEALSEQNSGEVLRPRDFNELRTTADHLHREIQSQYSLLFLAERGFDSKGERPVAVIPARPGLSVRVRRTYHQDDVVQH
jgi:VWFA-related protein